MCFQINEKAKRPRKKYVYKTLRLTRNGYLESPIYLTSWQPGEVKEAKGTSYYIASKFPPVKRAFKGIYVYLTYKDAAYYKSKYEVIVKLEVDPRDWIHTCYQGIRATYRKVKLLEEQPYIEFY